MHWRMEFDSGVGPSCYIFSSVMTVTDERHYFTMKSDQFDRPNYPSNCFTMDISQWFLRNSIEDGVADVQLGFISHPGTTVEIKLEDKRFSLNRPLLERKFYSSALDIKLDLGSILLPCSVQLNPTSTHLVGLS